MWKSPEMIIIDLAECALFAASGNNQVACDRIKCC